MQALAAHVEKRLLERRSPGCRPAQRRACSRTTARWMSDTRNPNAALLCDDRDRAAFSRSDVALRDRARRQHVGLSVRLAVAGAARLARRDARRGNSVRVRQLRAAFDREIRRRVARRERVVGSDDGAVGPLRAPRRAAGPVAPVQFERAHAAASESTRSSAGASTPTRRCDSGTKSSGASSASTDRRDRPLAFAQNPLAVLAQRRVTQFAQDSAAVRAALVVRRSWRRALPMTRAMN